MTQEPGMDPAQSGEPASEDTAPSPADEISRDAPDRTVADDETGALEAMRRADPAGAERLRREWGADFGHNLGHARKAAAVIADEGLIAALEETGLGNDPRVLRAAAKIGALLEGAQGSGRGARGAERRMLEQELDRLVGGADYWSDRVQRRVRQIYLSLHGGRSLPVHRSAGDAGGL